MPVAPPTARTAGAAGDRPSAQALGSESSARGRDAQLTVRSGGRRAFAGAPMAVARWLAGRLRRSLQLQVAATTGLASALVVLIVGIVLLGQISAGVLGAKKNAALAEASDGLRSARSQLAELGDVDRPTIQNALAQLVSTLSAKGSNAGLFGVVLLPKTPGFDPVYQPDGIGASQVPTRLVTSVGTSSVAYAYSPIARGDGVAEPGLIVGEPLSSPFGNFGLYYLFPLQTEQHSLDLIRQTVLLAGLVLVALVMTIALIVTRLVVRPVRQISTTAARLAAGELDRRSPVRGSDDLARLATSFNAMADSLSDQIGQLEELSRVQRRFVSDVSHELRTPLTTVRMAADVMHGAREQFPAGLDRAAELMVAELDRFETLLADLLEISRHDAQAADLECERTDLHRVVSRVLDGVLGLAACSGSDIVLRAPDAPVMAEIDARRVERILRNLLGNAIEHGEGLTIEVSLAAGDTAAAVLVRDHGVGFSDDAARRVFDRFWRADPSRARRTGGTGLGLAISLEDARLHRGTLDAWGRPGKGAAFRLTLPVVAGTDPGLSPLPLPSAGVSVDSMMRRAGEAPTIRRFPALPRSVDPGTQEQQR